MKTINVNVEDLAKTMTITACGMMTFFDMKFTKEMAIKMKDAFLEDLMKNNSIEKSVKQYKEEIENYK